MPLPAGTNCMTTTEDRWRTALSELTSVQTFLGVANAAAALDRILVNQHAPPASGEAYTPAEWTGLAPAVLMWTNPDGGFTASIVAENCVSYSGSIVIDLWRVQTDPELADPALMLRNFANESGDVLVEMVADPWLSILDAVYEGPSIAQEDDEEYDVPWVMCQITFTWGTRGGAA